MRVQRVLVIAAALVALPAPTAAAQDNGESITGTKGAHDYVLHFGAKAFRRVAGESVRLACTAVPQPVGFSAGAVPAPVRRTVRVPRRRGPVQTGVPAGRHIDFCAIAYTEATASGIARGLSVTVGITPAGRTYVEESTTAYSLFAPFFIGTGRPVHIPPPADRLAAQSHGQIVALPGPDATPPPRKVGYWTDEVEHFAIVALTGPGHRLFYEIDGHTVRSNAFGALSDPLLTDPVPAASRRPPVAGPHQGVTVTNGARGYVVHFGPAAAAAYRRIAGRRVSVGCSGPAPDDSFTFGDTFTTSATSATTRAPRRRGPLRTGVLRTAATVDYCFVRRGTDLVAVAPATAKGRTFLDNATTGDSLALPSSLVAPGTRRPPPAATIVARSAGRVVALDRPDATPPAGKVGYWTGGAEHYVVAALTNAGNRLFLESDGDVLRTNALDFSTAEIGL